MPVANIQVFARKGKKQKQKRNKQKQYQQVIKHNSTQSCKDGRGAKKRTQGCMFTMIDKSQLAEQNLRLTYDSTENWAFFYYKEIVT